MEQDSKLNHAVPPNQYVSARMEGRKRKCAQYITGGRTPKGYKVETRYEYRILQRTGYDNALHTQS